MFYGRRTWIATKVHAFEGVLPLGVDFGRQSEETSLCKKTFRFGRISITATKNDFKASPCKKCMERWKDIRVAEILEGE